MGDPTFRVINRFRVSADDAQFLADAKAAIAALGACPGFLEAALAQAIDAGDLLVLTSSWESVGAYRRALSNVDVKMTAVPLLYKAVDEESTFEVIHLRTPAGAVDAVTGLAADFGSIGLGEAAGPDIPALRD